MNHPTTLTLAAGEISKVLETDNWLYYTDEAPNTLSQISTIEWCEECLRIKFSWQCAGRTTFTPGGEAVLNLKGFAALESVGGGIIYQATNPEGTATIAFISRRSLYWVEPNPVRPYSCN